MKKISASLLSSDFARLADEIQEVEKAGADWIHLDIMDGHFVPNLTFGPPVIEKIKKVATVPLDVHLMISNADSYLEEFVQAGANYVSVHVEACDHLHRTLAQIRKLGAKPAVVVNPHSSLHLIDSILEDVEMVLLMSVNPGFGGQSFIPAVSKKVSELKKTREERNLNFLIEIDGGIKKENIADLSQKGVDVFVIGSGIFSTSDYAATIQEMKKLM